MSTFKLKSKKAKCFPMVLFLILAFSLPSLAMAWAGSCMSHCGHLQIKFPFGTGPGCGHPMFQRYVTCQQNQYLTLSTHTGFYRIQAIDYNNQIIYLSDPNMMSTCSLMHSSPNFGLDCNAPFRIAKNIFILLNCLPTSPIYDNPKNYICDMGNAGLCTSLYSCPGISGFGMPLRSPMTSCCVYSPMNLGPASELDLQKLQCATFTSIYSFGDDAMNPSQWRYGIALEYNYNAGNYVPSACTDCERSGGVCGYTGAYDAFVCVCSNGFNTTSHCYGQEYGWSKAVRHRTISKLVVAGFLLLMVILRL